MVQIRQGKPGDEMEYTINLDAIAYIDRDRRGPANSVTIHFIGGETLTLHDLKLGEIQRLSGHH